MHIRLASGLVIVLVFGLATTVVVGQDESSLSPQVTFEQLQQDYLFHIEKYQQAETRFNLDKAEYQKLQTLASREKAVESMRPYLEARTMVLLTYVVAHEYLLNQATAIDVTAKTQTIAQIRDLKTQLEAHLQTISGLADLQSINANAMAFESTQVVLFREVQYRTLSLLALGNVQRVFDQYDGAVTKFKEEYVTAIPEENTRAQIERGLKDVEFHRAAADTSLDRLIRSYPPFVSDQQKQQQNKPVNYQGYYNQTIGELQKALASTKQSLRFLKELERQL